MWKRFAFLTVLLLILSTAGAAQEANFSISLDPSSRTVQLGDAAEYTVSVTNQFPVEKRFAFSVFALSGWDVEPSTLTIPPNDTRDATVIVSTPKDVGTRAGQHGFFISVYPQHEPEKKQEVTGTLTIEREHSLVATTVQTNQFLYTPGEDMVVETTVKNVNRNEEVQGYRLNIIFAGNTYPVSLPTVDAGSSITVDKTIPIKKRLVGSQTVTAQLVTDTGQERHSNAVTVEVEELQAKNLSQTQENLVLWENGEQTVRNTGNVPLQDETLSADVPALIRWLVSTDPAPTTETTQGGTTTYTWEFASIQPGEARSVSHTIHYWVIYAFLLAVAVLAILVYRYLYAVTVEKHVVERGNGRAVHIYVKNKTFRDIDQLTVKDHVPGIASLVEQFETRAPDATRHTDDGVELEWDIDMLHSGEERVFTYRIKPRVQVEGAVQLPPATITYEQHGRELNRLSNKVTTQFTK